MAKHLLHWRETSRYMSYDGTPDTGYAWTSPTDPARYCTSMETMEHLIGIERSLCN